MGDFGRQLGLQLGVEELLCPRRSRFVRPFLRRGLAFVAIMALLKALLAEGVCRGFGATVVAGTAQHGVSLQLSDCGNGVELAKVAMWQVPN